MKTETQKLESYIKSEVKKALIPRVEHVEFTLSNGSHIVWVKESKGWLVTKYVHGLIGKHISTIGHLPTIQNAIYFDSEL